MKQLFSFFTLSFDYAKGFSIYYILPLGANDFGESVIARPDLLLADGSAILHPEILPDHELFYVQKLK